MSARVQYRIGDRVQLKNATHDKVAVIVQRNILCGDPRYKVVEPETLAEGWFGQDELNPADDPLRAFVADIAALELDALSPIDALSKLYELQRQARAVVKS